MKFRWKIKMAFICNNSEKKRNIKKNYMDICRRRIIKFKSAISKKLNGIQIEEEINEKE